MSIKLLRYARVSYVARYDTSSFMHYVCAYVIIALKINEIFTRGNESVERDDAFNCHFFTVFAS